VPSLWFCCPAYGRAALTRICLTQLRRTCDALEHEGIRASAVVVADDENLDTAHQLGFATVRRNNTYLSRKFNDAIQLALDPRHNPHPADYAVPIGSDDWVDHQLFLDLPDWDTMVGWQRLAVVREDGQELVARHLNYQGGAGIRIYPRQLMEPLGYRPADEDRARACDTSIFTNLVRYHGQAMRVEHRGSHACQIVDWKSPREQLNHSDSLSVHRGESLGDPYEALADWYPAVALREMRAHYAASRELVAA
jgi:hypothetical protein